MITRSGSPMLAADQIGDGGVIVGAVEVGLCLQKCFWGGDRKSLKPLMRFTRGEVRDHIVSSKIDNAPP